MESNFFWWAWATALMSAASGVDVLDRREFMGMNTSTVSRLLSSVFGIGQFVMFITAFFLFTAIHALALIPISGAVTFVAVKAIPAEQRAIAVLFFTVGIIAALAKIFIFV